MATASASSAAEPVTELHVATYDVFAVRPLAGNQLAVFTNCEWLSAAQMQQLAAEMNYAETTFILKPTGENPPANQIRYRIFTSAFELPFAGHPTIGTAYHAFKYLLPAGTPEVLLECKGGIIPVSSDSDGLLWMRQQPPKNERREADPKEVAAALKCDVEALDTTFPAQVFSTGGTCFLIVAVKSLAHLSLINNPGAAMAPLCEKLRAVGIYMVTNEGHDNTHGYSVRCMVNESAVPEDPATGSGCGCFAGWAMEHGYLSSPASIRIGQGYEMGRPSMLHLNVAQGIDGAPTVSVGGAVVPVIRGGRIDLS